MPITKIDTKLPDLTYDQAVQGILAVADSDELLELIKSYSKAPPQALRYKRTLLVRMQFQATADGDGDVLAIFDGYDIIPNPSVRTGSTNASQPSGLPRVQDGPADLTEDPGFLAGVASAFGFKTKK